MNQNQINDKMRLKRLELQLADNNEQKQKIQKALSILQLQKELEDIKDRIQRLRDS